MRQLIIEDEDRRRFSVSINDVKFKVPNVSWVGLDWDDGLLDLNQKEEIITHSIEDAIYEAFI